MTNYSSSCDDKMRCPITGMKASIQSTRMQANDVAIQMN